MYLLVHYPTDILGGIALGFMVSYIVCRRFLKKQDSVDIETS
ncbi:MAG: hypothetical protein WCS98_06095 [Bacillota bacterium]|nr:hypothetical protein [Bacillota bacterium]